MLRLVGNPINTLYSFYLSSSFYVFASMYSCDFEGECRTEGFYDDFAREFFLVELLVNEDVEDLRLCLSMASFFVSEP